MAGQDASLRRAVLPVLVTGPHCGPHGETVIRQRAAGVAVDPYSEESAPDWSVPPDSLAIDDCAVADGGSLEPNQDARSAAVSDFIVFAAPGTDVLYTDRLIIRGLTCKVEGRPFDWRSPYTDWRPGVVIRATIVEG